MYMELFGMDVEVKAYEEKVTEIKAKWEEEDKDWYEGILTYEEYEDGELHDWVWPE